MVKQNYKFCLGLFLMVFLIGVISAESCSITQRDSCTGGNNHIIMGVSSTTNAHGELASQGNYAYVLCCNSNAGNTACNGSNKIIGLELTTNSHAEIPGLNNYANDVCYEDFACVSRTTCNLGEVGILSLTNDTNSHMGGVNDYDTKICCTSEFLIDDGVCGNGILGAGEECDDGNLIERDGCSSVCEIESYNSSWCQDGILFKGYEECDDGNNRNGDGCSRVCERESRDDDDDDDDECNPDWDCSGWGDCVDGYRTRSCVDTENCGRSYNKPNEISECSDGVLSVIGNAVVNLGGGSESSRTGISTSALLWGLIILTLIILLVIVVLLLR